MTTLTTNIPARFCFDEHQASYGDNLYGMHSSMGTELFEYHNANHVGVETENALLNSVHTIQVETPDNDWSRSTLLLPEAHRHRVCYDDKHVLTEALMPLSFKQAKRLFWKSYMHVAADDVGNTLNMPVPVFGGGGGEILTVGQIMGYIYTLDAYGAGGYGLQVEELTTSISVEYSVSYASDHSKDMVETGYLHETNTTDVSLAAAGYQGRVVYARYRAVVTNDYGTTTGDWVDLDPVALLFNLTYS